MRKKRTILAAEEEQGRMQRQASQTTQQSHFRQFISSVTSRSQSVDISLRDLKSEVADSAIGNYGKVFMLC